MCGILGHFSAGDFRADPLLWRRLVNTLAHRGPDDSTFWQDGRFILGHRRLSIIDLAQGHQPMATEDGDLVVSFNGEIYNYLELRQELTARGHRLRTKSDTEVLLYGYREWGVDLPAKLLGMFAFAIADRRRHELFVARDRFGEKPLLYVEDADGVAFASELKTLAALPGLSRAVNERALAAYLCLNYVPGEDTMLEAVKRLGPGSWRLWTADGAVRTGKYWTPPDPSAPDLDIGPAETLERLEALVDQSTRLALRSDVPVGIFLSGGIDSSLVAQSAARSGHLVQAYCLTFAEPSYSEWPKAERVASRLGIPIVEVRLTANALADFFDVVDHADDPLADSSALAVWVLARRASRDIKVALSGDGGDELFAGYLTYQATLWHESVIAKLPMSVRRLLARAGRALPTSEEKVSATYKLRRFLRAAALAPSVAHFTWNGTWLPAEAARLLAGPGRQAAANHALDRLVESHRLPRRPTVRELQAADVSDYLPNDILTKSDRMSMAHGLEVRAPLLDASLAEFALRLPTSQKTGRTGIAKKALRELAGRTYGVDVTAPKQGFSIPIHAWLRGPGRPLVDDLLSPASLASIPALDDRGVSAALADHMSGRRSYGFEIWGLAVLAAWHRRYAQGRVDIPDGPPPRLVEIKMSTSQAP
jgi:asparagine synthase (glutamine-hydrolysing)